jgi:hypothetical protein
MRFIMLNINRVCALALAVCSTAAFSESTWTCTAEQWVTEPTVQNNLFKGVLYRECQVVNAAGGGLATLNDFFLTGATTGVVVNSGPTDETWETLPGVRYDVTSTTTDSNGTLNVRSDVHYVTDEATRFVYANISKTVSGTGNVQYIRKLDTTMDTAPASDVGHYAVRFWTTLHVAKPPMIPSGSFLNMAKSSMVDQFVKGTDGQMPGVADHL